MATARKTPQPQPDSAVVDQANAADTPHQETLASPPFANELAHEPRYRITARHPKGFWRCGRQWHPDGELLTLSEIGGEAVLAMLRVEPMLIVALDQ